MHEGIYRNDKDMIQKGIEILDLCLELVWDMKFQKGVNYE